MAIGLVIVFVLSLCVIAYLAVMHPDGAVARVRWSDLVKVVVSFVIAIPVVSVCGGIAGAGTIALIDCVRKLRSDT